MIPEAAVEAAAHAEWVRCGSYDPTSTWETEAPEYRDYLRAAMRAALEAAAPHMRQAFYLEMNLRAVQDELRATPHLAERGGVKARDELADVFTGHRVSLGSSPAKLMRGHAQEIAALILAAGYRRPTPCP